MTRLAPQDALATPRRRQIMDALQSNPGIAFRELSRLIGLPAGTLRHHLNVLCRARFIVERRYGATLRLFHAESDANWVELALRRDPALAVLHDWLKLNPPATQRKILETMSAKGWPRSTTQHRLRRLTQAGLAIQIPRGRFKLYSAAQLTAEARPSSVPEAAHTSALLSTRFQQEPRVGASAWATSVPAPTP